MPSTRIAALVMALQLVAAVAGGAPKKKAEKYHAKLFRQAGAYVKQHGLAKRAVVLECNGQRVTRLFVPIVSEEQRTDFEDRFSKKHNAVLWAQGRSADYYAKLITEPAKHFFRYNGDSRGWIVTSDKNHPHAQVMPFTRYIALELEPEKIAGLENHFAQYDTTAKWQAARPGVELKVPDAAHGSCMWWMGNAEIGLNQPLWAELGIRRSIAPENIRKRLLHLGNQRVSVVGVPVGSIAEFKAMSREDLLGLPPMTKGPDGRTVPER